MYFKPPNHMTWHGESRKNEKPRNSWWNSEYTIKNWVLPLNKKGRGVFFCKKWKEGLSAEGRLLPPTFTSGLWSLPLPSLGSRWGESWHYQITGHSTFQERILELKLQSMTRQSKADQIIALTKRSWYSKGPEWHHAEEMLASFLSPVSRWKNSWGSKP